MNFHLWKPKKMDQQTQAHGALYSVFFVFCVYLVPCETNTAKNTYSNVLPFYLCAHPNENFPSLNIGQASHQSRVQRLKPRLDHRRCLRILYMTQLPHRWWGLGELSREGVSYCIDDGGGRIINGRCELLYRWWGDGRNIKGGSELDNGGCAWFFVL